MVSRRKIFLIAWTPIWHRISAHAGSPPARSRQSQRQSARRLSVHPLRSAAAFHLHERGRIAARCRNDSARSRPRVSCLRHAEEDLYDYRDAPIEFCEVASMSMELLGNEFIEEFYSRTTRRARRLIWKASSASSRGSRPSTLFSIGFIRILATRVPSDRSPGWN